VFHVVFAVFSARKLYDDVGKFCVFQVVSFTVVTLLDV